jgi:hypothetical protein
MNKQDKADHAYDLYREILDTIPEETLRVFKLGHLFKRIRDEKLYKCLDSECDNFGQFCADPKVGYQRATIYAYIEIWEKYIEELHLSMDALREIVYTRLRLMRGVVSKDPDEWLSRARSWSDKDFINAVRKEKGRQPMPAQEEVQTKVGGRNYMDYVSKHPCILHPSRKSERAHFPKTRGAGAPDFWVIPLCHECHQVYHNVGVNSFFELYKEKIFDFFYNAIERGFWKIDKISLAYAAGVIDGDGSFSISEEKRDKKIYYSTILQVGMMHPEIPDWLKETYGGFVYYNKSNGMHSWNITGRKAGDLAQSLYPYLRGRKKAANIFMEFVETLQLPSAPKLPTAIHEKRHKLARLLSQVNTGKPRE